MQQRELAFSSKISRTPSNALIAEVLLMMLASFSPRDNFSYVFFTYGLHGFLELEMYLESQLQLTADDKPRDLAGIRVIPWTMTGY